ncbi:MULTISPECIES: aspartate carbamoyltransferase catalytic subunit [unclassified Actinobaculum]|uniref:aspartate carbamoyltransferase catalytic subunit n=1 Tax=unclassified Actinobaculum TaxID=2609299 RepID=UPI000D529E81|nr:MULTISPECIES: aspartate carbamoyltransferase catalytic subunit [unclassified Actinobaculum]AWE42378.1 aspartate carbamoyltransferase [Actinobaculum sp. 313]RTE48364.1 aspartate carbamoyltransferase catalytic subunit [Actinobaculum sp. 352]
MRHLLSTRDLSRDDVLLLLDTAEAMAATQARTIKKLPVLRGRTVATLFFEDSTRTRLSFETAAKRLSMDVISFSARGSSLSKGESLKDTAQTIVAMGAEALIVRHSASGAPQRLADTDWVDVPILNAGDGTHQHPTQALLDAFTLRRHLHRHDDLPAPDGSGLDGAHVAIVGDILHSRVARSNVELMTTLGARVTLVAPPTLLPVGMDDWTCDVVLSLDEAITAHPDAVMMLRVQRERMSHAGGGFFPSPFEYHRTFGLNSQRLAALGPDAVVMHPGPMNRGLEITAEAADSARSVVTEQVANGISVRMAALYLLLAHGEEIAA